MSGASSKQVCNVHTLLLCSRLPDLDKFNKAVQKATLAMNEVPKVYIKTVVLLEDAVNKIAANKEAAKKLPPAHSKALAVLKQKVKKNNVTYEKQISEYRKVSLFLFDGP